MGIAEDDRVEHVETIDEDSSSNIARFIDMRPIMGSNYLVKFHSYLKKDVNLAKNREKYKDIRKRLSITHPHSLDST